MGSDGKRVITLGGKGSSLSSAAVFQISNSLSLLRIDSSSKLFSPSPPPTETLTLTPQFSLPNYLNPEQLKATLVLLLNKLLLHSSPTPNLTVPSSHLIDILNRPDFNSLTTDDYQTLTLIVDEISPNSAAVQGICALLDHRCFALSSISDAVVALSCEALRADIINSSLGSFTDSGDGSSDKDEVGVASDLRVFLNGSKLIGKDQQNTQNPATNFDDVLEIHGVFRFVCRTLHSKTRMFLNSNRAGSGNAVFLLPLAKSLLSLGVASLQRAHIIVGSLENNNADLFGASFMEMYNAKCPGVDRLKELFNSVQAADNDDDYLKSVHDIYVLCDLVRKIISWEAIAAFVSLSVEDQGGTGLFIQRNRVVEVKAATSGGDDKSILNEKKQHKEKKKNKVVMGKGTAALMQFLKDRLQAFYTKTNGGMEKWAQQFLSYFDPKDPGFEGLLERIKEIVDSNESRRLPKLPKGTRDFAKEQMAVREKAFSIICEVFKRHGAMALDTPAFEMRETLMGKYGEDSKLIYDLADQGGELCSLRYDLTVPFARYVAMNGLTSFKRYQIAKVYRRDNPSKGRYREFYQCDFDIAGQFETMGPDFEVIKILTELLDELNIGDYEVKLNHRKLLDGMLDICGVPPEKFRTICSSIDKLDKQSFEQIKQEMVEEKGLNVETADKIGTFVKQKGRPLELLFELRNVGSKFIENSASLQALNELQILFNALERAQCIDKVVLDLSLARGLDYYTGVIYEAVFKGATQVGSIAAGGRYDKLIGMFGTKQVPAVGVSLGIERVFTIMEQLQKDQNQAVRATETQVLVSVLGDDLSLAAELVSECWAAKLKAEYLVNKRVTKHFDRAKDSKIPWMVIVGERELTEGFVKLKDMVANKEDKVPRSDFVQELCRRLS